MNEITLPTWHTSGLTFAFHELNDMRMSFAFEARKHLQLIEAEMQKIAAARKHPELLHSTKQRLDGLYTAHQSQLKSLRALLLPLGYRELSLPAEESLAHLSQAKSVLASNFENLFRDWVWGDDEVSTTVREIEKALDNVKPNANVLFLGAGGCRIPYELHHKFTNCFTTVSDINPLLLSAAQKAIHGDGVQLIEFPSTPAINKPSFFERQLIAKKPIVENFDFLVSDARIPAFAEKTIDIIFTPWLLDVVHMDLADFLSVLNFQLPINGTWINTGPLQFEYRGVENMYSLAEIKEIVNMSGFCVEYEHVTRIPYMNSQDIGTARTEEVFTFRARKIKDVELVEFNPLMNQPDWYLDHQLPIRFPGDSTKLANAYHTNAHILRLVDGERTLNSITQELMKQFKNAQFSEVKYFAANIIKNSAL